MAEEQKQVQITPDTALGYIDNVLEKYEGTRADHKVLEACMSLLRNVVAEWKTQKAQPAADTSTNGKKKRARPSPSA